MNRNAILNAMEKKARDIFDDNPDYIKAGKRGMMVVEIRDPKISNQWDSSCRNFGTVFRDYGYEGELVVNNGQNFDALVHGKIAFCRRTNKDSGTNYYQVLGYESYWKGAIISDDGDCICAFAGFMGVDDAEIARSGIKCYESLKRTGKSLVTGGDPDHEEDSDQEPGDEGGEVSDNEAGEESAEKPMKYMYGADDQQNVEAEKTVKIPVGPKRKVAPKTRGRKRKK